MERFKRLVLFLAKNSECGNLEIDEEITKFEDAIKESGKGEAYFGIAKSNWENIEIIKPECFPYRYKNEGVKYYAEYYDGMQAPFESNSCQSTELSLCGLIHELCSICNLLQIIPRALALWDVEVCRWNGDFSELEELQHLTNLKVRRLLETYS